VSEASATAAFAAAASTMVEFGTTAFWMAEAMEGASACA